MNLEDWGKIGVVCGTLIALGTVIGWVYRKVVRPMWRHTVRSWRRINRGADDLLGKPAEYDDEGNLVSPEVTSLRTEIIKLQSQLVDMRRDLDTHLLWHQSPRGRPAAGPLPKRRRNGAAGEIT